MLDVEIRVTPSATVAYLQGVADTTTCGQLLATLTNLVSSRPARIVVVMDALDFIDSWGIGALVRAFHIANDLKLPFYTVSQQSHIRRVLQITGLDRIIPLCRTEQAALSLGT